MASNGLIIGAAQILNIVLRRQNGLPLPPGSMCPRTTVLAPTHTSPFSIAAGSAVHFFTCGNLSIAIPLANLSLSTAPIDTFLHLSATLPGYTFAPLSATGLGFRQVETTPEMSIGLK